MNFITQKQCQQKAEELFGNKGKCKILLKTVHSRQCIYIQDFNNGDTYNILGEGNGWSKALDNAYRNAQMLIRKGTLIPGNSYKIASKPGVYKYVGKSEAKQENHGECHEFERTDGEEDKNVFVYDMFITCVRDVEKEVEKK